MKPKHALLALLATFAALSALLAFLEARGLAEPVSVQVGSTLVLTALVFLWFWLDSESRSYKRSPFLSIAVIAVAFLAVPYYLLRSRPKGQRLKAMGNLAAFVLLLVAAMFVGELPGVLLGQYI